MSALVSRAYRLAADARSLGIGAPLRAAYESSKRMGGHAVVFGGLARRSNSQAPPNPRPPFKGTPEISSVPQAAIQRTLEEAGRIADGEIVLFGAPLPLGVEPDPSALVEREGRWPELPWWQIDLRSERRPADVKWAWELGRHRHVVVLSRATALTSGAAPYIRVLDQHMRSWLLGTSLERGVQWYSNLEIALRSMTWLEVLAVAGRHLSPDVATQMALHLRHAQRHILADLPYTVSTMRNNHLLGDALGLMALAAAFPGSVQSRATQAIGRRLFDAQLVRHMRPDGSMIEDSLSYHRFVLEMLCRAESLPRSAASEHARELTGAAQFLVRLGALEGPVPQYGDWDEGRVLATSGSATDVAGSTLLALALAGEGAPAEWRKAHDECAWYSSEGDPITPDAAVIDGSHVGGGILRAAQGELAVWLKAGGGPSHGHADLTSVAIRLGDDWVVGDPGTGAYNASLEVRNHFRTSVAHSVVRVGEHDQLEPHRAFRWQNTADGVPGDPVPIRGGVVMWGAHRCYTRLSPGSRVARAVIVRDGGVVVIDWIERATEPLSLSIPLAPETLWDAEQRTITTGSGRRLHFSGPSVVAVRGNTRPFDGWWSETYGQLAPATRLEMRARPDRPLVWAVTHDPIDLTTRQPDGPSSVRIDGLALEVAWGTTDVSLRVSGEGTDATRYLNALP